jgi:hypothetical protein
VVQFESILLKSGERRNFDIAGMRVDGVFLGVSSTFIQNPVQAQIVIASGGHKGSLVKHSVTLAYTKKALITSIRTVDNSSGSAMLIVQCGFSPGVQDPGSGTRRPRYCPSRTTLAPTRV